VLVPAIAVFVALLATGVVVEVYSARADALRTVRDRLNRAIGFVSAHPARAWAVIHDWRERSYHAPRDGNRSSVMKWAIRAHVFVVVPAATYFGANAFEALAADSRPIAGTYMSPAEAWYFGAIAGFVTAALAPLLAYMVFWALVVLPLAIITAAVRFIRRRIIDATDSVAGWDQAPFAIAGAALGVLAAGGMAVLGR